jgi:TPR repeat protein
MTLVKSKAVRNYVAMHPATDSGCQTWPTGNLAKNVLVVLTIAYGLASSGIARAEDNDMDLLKEGNTSAGESAQGEDQARKNFESLKKAAKAGDVNSMDLVAMHYQSAKNYAEAIRWYKLAAAKGDILAQDFLAGIYEVGEGVTQNHAEAARWHKKGAEQGYAEAQLALSLAYLSGRGVPRNFTEAYFWANLGVALGTFQDAESANLARDTRDRAASFLSPSALAKVQKRCEKWTTAFNRRKTQRQ